MSLAAANTNKGKQAKSRIPFQQHDVDNVRRSPRKKKEEPVEKGRRKLDFNKDNRKISRDRLKGIVAYVDVTARQNEIKERIAYLGGKVEEFLDKCINLIITNCKIVDKSDGRFAENSPLSGAGPSPLPYPLSNKNSLYSPCSTDSPQYSVESARKERVVLSRSQKMMSKVKKGSGSADIRETAKLIGAKVISAEEFSRKYMPKKQTSENSIKNLKNKPLQKLRKSSSGSRVVADIQVSKLAVPCLKIEDRTYAFRPLIHETKEWPRIYYNTALVQTAFDPPKPASRSKINHQTPRADDAKSKDDEETLSIDLKSDKLSETIEESKKTDKKEDVKKEVKKVGEKPGYCDCCTLRYKDLKKHLKSDHHRRFARDPSNFKELDKLINKGINFQTFLDELKAVLRLQELNRNLFGESSTTNNKNTVANSNPLERRLSVEEKKALPVPVFPSSPVKLPTKQQSGSPKRSPRERKSPDKVPDISISHCPTNFLQVDSQEKSGAPGSPLWTPQGTDDNKRFSYPVIATESNTNAKTGSPTHVEQRIHYSVASTPKDTTIIIRRTPFPTIKEGEPNNYNAEVNEESDAPTQTIKTPRSEDRELRRKVKQRKRRKSSRRSSQSQSQSQLSQLTIVEEDAPGTVQDEFTKIILGGGELEDTLVADADIEVNPGVAVCGRLQISDPEITFNTGGDPLLELLLSPSKRMNSRFSLRKQLVEESIEESIENKSNCNESQTNDIPINNPVETNHSLNSTCELTLKPDDAASCELIHKPEMTLRDGEGFEEQLNSRVEENDGASDEHLKENVEPCYLGLNEQGLHESFRDMITCPREHQSGHRTDEPMFSDDRDANDDIIVNSDLEMNLSAVKNIVNVEEFESVDDISVAIFKHGSTPKGNRTTRSRFAHNDDHDLSPSVIGSCSRTPRRTRSASEDDMIQSPSMSCLKNRRTRTPRKDNDRPDTTPTKHRRESRKRSLNTPNSERARKRSRTVSTTVQDAPTTAEAYKAIDFNDVFENVKKEIHEETTKRKHSVSKRNVPDHQLPTVFSESLFEAFREGIDEEKTRKQHHAARKRDLSDHELAAVFASSIYDRIKSDNRRSSRTTSTCSQSSTRSNSPCQRKRASSESTTVKAAVRKHTRTGDASRRKSVRASPRKKKTTTVVSANSVSDHVQISRSSPRKKTSVVPARGHASPKKYETDHAQTTRASPRKKTFVVPARGHASPKKYETDHPQTTRASPRKKTSVVPVRGYTMPSKPETDHTICSSPRKKTTTTVSTAPIRQPTSPKKSEVSHAKSFRTSPRKKTFIVPSQHRRSPAKSNENNKKPKAEKKRLKSKLKNDSPFGDPRTFGKTKDKNWEAILDDFEDVFESEHNNSSSQNSSLNSSMTSRKTPSYQRKKTEERLRRL